jgi:hypothetical protein
MEPMKPMKPMEPMRPMEGMKPMEPMKPMKPIEAWWPQGLGQPNSVGAQNDTRYAYFAGARRLVVARGGDMETYDTGSHRIGGFGQQQGGGDSMTFSSESGPVALSSLRKL